MKKLVFLLLFFALLGCEDNTEDIYRYSKIITQSKQYPVYLDMSEIGNIQVETQVPLEAPFKIVSNDTHYFVGDRLNGIHVYQKSAGSVSYLCFIACKYLKDLALVDDRLFCNNFVDMVVLDVSNPLQAIVLHREEHYFNRFTSYKTSWNIPYEEGKGLIVAWETHELTGRVTEKEPNLDFTQYDELYSHLTTTELPESWFGNQPEWDKPYIGMITIGTEEVYSYGSYNSWAISSYLSGTFNAREEDLWTTPRGNYAPPYYYADAFPVKMFYQDSLIFILGTSSASSGYCDCITYNEAYPFSYHLYFSSIRPLDVAYLPAMEAFFVVSGYSVWGAFKDSNGESSYMERYLDYGIESDATSLFIADNMVVTLGSQLSVYSPSDNELQLVAAYPDITGSCYSKAGDVLAVANTQGLFLYDISNLEDIKTIP
jgi:hypothetical protein